MAKDDPEYYQKQASYMTMAEIRKPYIEDLASKVDAWKARATTAEKQGQLLSAEVKQLRVVAAEVDREKLLAEEQAIQKEVDVRLGPVKRKRKAADARLAKARADLPGAVPVSVQAAAAIATPPKCTKRPKLEVGAAAAGSK